MANTSAIAVVIVAVMMATTAGAAVVIATHDDSVEVKIIGPISQWGEYVDDCADALIEAGAKDVVVSLSSNTLTMTFKAPSTWTMDYLDDDIIYEATNNNCDLFFSADDYSYETCLYEHYDHLYSGFVCYLGPGLS